MRFKSCDNTIIKMQVPTEDNSQCKTYKNIQISKTHTQRTRPQTDVKRHVVNLPLKNLKNMIIILDYNSFSTDQTAHVKKKAGMEVTNYKYSNYCNK